MKTRQDVAVIQIFLQSVKEIILNVFKEPFAFQQMSLQNVFCHIVCVALVKNGASQKDVIMLLSTERELREHREHYMQYDVIWRVDEKIFIQNFEKIKKLYSFWQIKKSPDFTDYILLYNL